MSLEYRNRKEAGETLAAFFDDLRDRDDVIVLGLPRGGVPVAAEVAQHIGAPLDAFIVRKIGAPRQPELAIGAIASGDVLVLSDDLIADLGVTREQIQKTIDRETTELHRREREYRGDRVPIDLRSKTVVLIDDGLATGTTMLAAVKAVRSLEPAQIMIGVPVGARDSVEMLRRQVDRIECPRTPFPFTALGMWYQDFRPTQDVEVQAALGTLEGSA